MLADDLTHVSPRPRFLLRLSLDAGLRFGSGLVLLAPAVVLGAFHPRGPVRPRYDRTPSLRKHVSALVDANMGLHAEVDALAISVGTHI